MVRSTAARWASALGFTLVVALALPMGAPTAWAQDGPSGNAAAKDDTSAPFLVAVLPFAAPDRRMSMYGKPVADAVARALGKRVAADNIEVRAISLSAAVPKRVRLVIDGRLVTRTRTALYLEAQVRDPEMGTRMASVSGEPGELTDVDELASTLGERLIGPVRDAVARVRARSRGTGTEQTKPRGPGSEQSPQGAAGTKRGNAGASDGTDPGAGEVPTKAQEGPPLVVFTPSGKAAGGTIEVADLAAKAMRELASDLGYRPVMSQLSDIVDRKRTSAALKSAGAQHGLMLEVRDVAFKWRGVLTARGRFRAWLIDAEGQTLAYVAGRTDTLVGARSDRHRAVLRYVLVQVVDVLRARMKAYRYMAPGASPGAKGRRHAGS